jgi:uncharacterized iron-regulated membrane protein
VSSRGRALAMGLALASLYLVLAAVSGRLSLLARRPLLDGFAPPPPYRWVRPPPSLASANKKPSSGRFAIALAATGSEAGVFSTDDSQASLALGPGAIKPTRGEVSVLLRIVPMAPATGGSLPKGMVIAGNVYQLTGVYRPSGSQVGKLKDPGQMVLAYPVTDTLIRQHTLLSSTDGRSWTAVPSIDSIAQALVQGNVSELGYFAVGQARSGRPRHTSKGTIVYRVILIAGIAAIVAAIGLAELRIRRRRRRSGRSRPPRRPPPSRRRSDPWRD